MDLAVIDRSIPIHAMVFRRDSLPLDDYPTEIGPLYDLWTAYLLARTGGGAWYHPDRLSYYRVHADQQTAKGASSNASATIFYCNRLLAEEDLGTSRGALRQRLAAAHFHLGVTQAANQDRAGARRSFRSASATLPRARFLAAFGASYLTPGLLSSRAQAQR
jgi:hypothetical protein